MRFVRGRLALPDNGLRRAGATGLRVPALHDVLWWLLAGTIALLAAAILWAVVTPVSPLGPWQPSTVRVMGAQQRAALFAAMDPFSRAAPVAGNAASNGAATVTSLSLTLFATRGTPGGGGSAIIAGADGVQQVYRTGTEVMPGVQLAAVAFDHVVLARNGAQELLYLDQSREAPSAEGVVEGNPVAVPAPAPAAGAGASGPLTLEAARSGIGFSPRNEGGRMTGLEVQSQGDGNAFRAAGFQPGDVITAIDGKPVDGADDTAALAGAMRPGSSVSVTVRRGGRQLPLAITLAQ